SKQKFACFYLQAGLFPEFPDKGFSGIGAKFNTPAWRCPKRAICKHFMVDHEDGPLSVLADTAHPRSYPVTIKLANFRIHLGLPFVLIQYRSTSHTKNPIFFGFWQYS